MKETLKCSNCGLPLVHVITNEAENIGEGNGSIKANCWKCDDHSFTFYTSHKYYVAPTDQSEFAGITQMEYHIVIDTMERVNGSN